MRFEFIKFTLTVASLAVFSTHCVAQDASPPDYPFALTACGGELRTLRWSTDSGALVAATVALPTETQRYGFEALKGQRLILGRSCTKNQEQFVPAVLSNGEGVLLILNEKTGARSVLRIGSPFMFLGVAFLGAEPVVHGGKGEAGYIAKLERRGGEWLLSDEVKISETNVITSVGTVGGVRFAAGLVPDKGRPMLNVFPLTETLARADTGRRLPCGPSFADAIKDRIVVLCAAQFSLSKPGLLVHKISSNFRDITTEYLPTTNTTGFVSSACEGNELNSFAFVGVSPNLSLILTTMPITGAALKSIVFDYQIVMPPPQGIDCIRKSPRGYFVTNALRLATRMSLPPLQSLLRLVEID